MNRPDLKKPKKSTVLMGLGLLLIAAALVLMAYTQWDENRAKAETAAVVEQLRPLTETAEGETAGQPWQQPEYAAFPDREMPVVEIGGELYIGTLEIPALELTLPVMSQWSASNLKTAPCRYQGTVYRNDLVIAAHNYWCHFGQLKNLLHGDEITFTDADGNRYLYHVLDMEVVQPTDIEQMCTGDWDLTLFTCTYGGQTRLALRCERAEDQ